MNNKIMWQCPVLVSCMSHGVFVAIVVAVAWCCLGRRKRKYEPHVKIVLLGIISDVFCSYSVCKKESE